MNQPGRKPGERNNLTTITDGRIIRKNMNDSEMTRNLQKIELLILKDVAEICEKNCLKYYLIGGTLLGAVRHQGFIPWDDDIDIAMLREDYKKLFSIMRESYSDKYFVQTFETEPNYTRYIMKIRLNGTKHVEEGVSDVGINHGIYMDIFPIDNLEGDTVLSHFRGGLFRTLLAYKNIKHRANHYHGYKRLLSFVGKFFTYLIPERLINKLFVVVCERDNNKECNYLTNFASRFKWKKQMYPKEYFGEGVYLDFEGMKFRAPIEYKKILERLFGDYMKLPPKEKQTAHHIIEVDFGEYKKYLGN